MRLLLVMEDLLTGGAQTHAVELALRLRARGWTVEVLVLGRHVAPTLADRLGAGLIVLDQQGLQRPAEWGRLATAIAARGADVVMAVNQVAGCVVGVGRAAGRIRAPATAVLHCTQVGSWAGWARTAPFLALARQMRTLVFVSERQRAHWTRRGAPVRRATVIPNGVDLALHVRRSAEARAAAKQALGLDPSDLVVGAVAMFRREKNHFQMLDALCALRGAGVRASLVLVGDGPTRPRAEAYARRLGLERDVRFCGEQSDVRPYLAALDAGLLCSTRVETSPLFAMELMASGAPLVAPRIGGLEELISNGEDGLLFTPGDTGALVRQLKRCADPMVRRRLSHAAHVKARGFCVDVMADRYAGLFDAVAQARAA